MTRSTWWRVGLFLVVAGCDTTVADSPPVEAPDHDAALTALITRDGQRGLAVFRQPDSGDYSAIPQDPANPLTPEKVTLGRLLFHETALSTRPVRPALAGTWGCATCHHADAGFQAGRRQAIGQGGSGWGARGEGRRAILPSEIVDVQPVRTPSVMNIAFQDVMHWDGSLGAVGQNAGTEAAWREGTPAFVNHLGLDGPESQAIAALSAHGLDSLAGSVLETNPDYIALWEEAFPGEGVTPQRAGLAIAAYERTIFADRSPFQRWLRGDLAAMTEAEKRGAIVFFGDSGCETCHTGPGLSGPGFYALGMPDMDGPLVIGAVPETRGRGGFLEDPGQHARFKVPQLYNLADSPFLGHGGTFTSVRAVIEYYNEGLPAVQLPPGIVEPRFRPLHLTESQVEDLTAFVRDALRDPDLGRYVPDQLPSGNCFPANDEQARRDLGCD